MPLQSSSRLALYLSKVLENKTKQKKESREDYSVRVLYIRYSCLVTQLMCGEAGFNFRSNSKGLPLLIFESVRKTLLENESEKGELVI